MKLIKRFLKWLNDGAGWEFGLVACAALVLSGCLMGPDSPPQTEFSQVYHVREMEQSGAIVKGGDTVATRSGLLFTFRLASPPKRCLAYVIDSLMVETEVICRTFEPDSAKVAVLGADFYAVKGAMWVKLLWSTRP